MSPTGELGKLSRASIAVDLGAESCRVSLLRWAAGKPTIELVHRFSNGPSRAGDGSLRWNLRAIIQGVEAGIRACAEKAPEGVVSIGVDGWAVDYVRIDGRGEPLEDPYCYRDERNIKAQAALHDILPAERLHEITGVQIQPLNTLYQLYADRLSGIAPGQVWLNLPEFLLSRWSGVHISEWTMATHTELVDARTRQWSPEILNLAGLDAGTFPPIVSPGTILGPLMGPLAGMAALRETLVVAPACHDTASAINGVPASDENWAYVSSGTWSLVGVPSPQPLKAPHNDGQFTSLGLCADRYLVQKNLNGMWLLKQCMDEWVRAGKSWTIKELCEAAREARAPDSLLDIEDTNLQLTDNMPGRINAQRRTCGLEPLDESPAGAPAMAALIFHSIAAAFARVLKELEQRTERKVERVYFVGGGSRNVQLLELTSKFSGKQVSAASPESSTVGNFSLQLAALENPKKPPSHRAIAECARRISLADAGDFQHASL